MTVFDYTRGALARMQGHAFLSNPFPRTTPQWEAWRLGWLDEDLTMRTGEPKCTPNTELPNLPA